MAALLVGANRGILSRTTQGTWAKDPGPTYRQRAKRRISVAQAYCVRDKMKVEMKDPVKVTMKNGKPAWKGTCPKCGNSVFRIGA